MYICKLIKRKVDDEPVEVWYLFRPTVINKTGDLSTEIAKFLFFVGALRIYHLFRCQ